MWICTCGCIKDGENIEAPPLYHFFSYSLSIVAEKIHLIEFFLLPLRRKNLGLTPLSMFFLCLWNISIHRNLDSFLVEAGPIPLRLRRSDTGDASGSNVTDVHPSQHFMERIRWVEAELDSKVQRLESEVLALDAQLRDLGVRYEQLRIRYDQSVARETGANAWDAGVQRDFLRLKEENARL